jgi:transposase-like protein
MDLSEELLNLIKRENAARDENDILRQAALILFKRANANPATATVKLRGLFVTLSAEFHN